MAKSAKAGGKDRGRNRIERDRSRESWQADFDERLDRARRAEEQEAPEGAKARGSAMGTAFRIASELIAGLVVGGFIGWQLDRWFDSSPVFLLIFFILGAAAGIWNVIRTALQMQAEAQETAATKNPGSKGDSG
ncbi:MAG: AtpZ/AtpI family protein [Hyphomicrobiaceae bacterium]|nr:AtpZ/AtpI family protein [Hyphomicrobiaceae bacterium]